MATCSAADWPAYEVHKHTNSCLCPLRRAVCLNLVAGQGRRLRVVAPAARSELRLRSVSAGSVLEPADGSINQPAPLRRGPARDPSRSRLMSANWPLVGSPEGRPIGAGWRPLRWESPMGTNASDSSAGPRLSRPNWRRRPVVVHLEADSQMSSDRGRTVWRRAELNCR